MAGRLSACLLRKLTSTEVSNSAVSSPPKIEKPVTGGIKFSAVPGGSPRKLFRRSWLIPIPAAWHRRRGSHPARRSQRVQCQDGVNLRNLSHATRLRLGRQAARQLANPGANIYLGGGAEQVFLPHLAADPLATTSKYRACVFS